MFACHLLNSDNPLDRLLQLADWDLEWDGTRESPLTCQTPLLLQLADTPDLLEDPKQCLSALCHRDAR